MHEFFRNLVLATIFTPFLLMGIGVGFAQVMQSPNYQIQSDSINVGGGLSSSTNYSLESTAGELATGDSDSSSYALRAGYQQMQEVFISLTGAQAVVMSPSIPGVSGGTANGSTTVTVTTDSPSGYALTIEASQSPAMQKDGDSIADYETSAGFDPDYTFDTNATDAHFGYTPEGEDIVSYFRDGGGNCNTGVADSPLFCWEGLSTTARTIASDTDPNHPDGTETIINFRVGIGGSVVQAPGTYTATTTLTALPL